MTPIANNPFSAAVSSGASQLEAPALKRMEDIIRRTNNKLMTIIFNFYYPTRCKLKILANAVFVITNKKEAPPRLGNLLI